jgi:hypothetical protein
MWSQCHLNTHVYLLLHTELNVIFGNSFHFRSILILHICVLSFGHYIFNNIETLVVIVVVVVVVVIIAIIIIIMIIIRYLEWHCCKFAILSCHYSCCYIFAQWTLYLCDVSVNQDKQDHVCYVIYFTCIYTDGIVYFLSKTEFGCLLCNGGIENIEEGKAS